MAISCVENGQALTVCIEGEIDHHAARELMEQLTHHIDTARPRSLALDLSAVSFMDSSGIAVVLRAWKHMGRLGGSMTLENVPTQAGKVLKAAGVDKIVPFTA